MPYLGIYTQATSGFIRKGSLNTEEVSYWEKQPKNGPNKTFSCTVVKLLKSSTYQESISKSIKIKSSPPHQLFILFLSLPLYQCQGPEPGQRSVPVFLAPPLLLWGLMAHSLPSPRAECFKIKKAVWSLWIAPFTVWFSQDQTVKWTLELRALNFCGLETFPLSENLIFWIQSSS